MDLFTQPEQDFSEYEALSDYQRKCLPATNFWRLASGLPIIPVPSKDENYKQNFSPEKERQAREIYQTKKQRAT